MKNFTLITSYDFFRQPSKNKIESKILKKVYADAVEKKGKKVAAKLLLKRKDYREFWSKKCWGFTPNDSSVAFFLWVCTYYITQYY